MEKKVLYTTAQWVLWGLLVFSLPITSFPLITRLAGGSMVGPAAIIPLLLLFLVWWLPYLIKRGSLPRQSLPLIGFAMVALFSSLLSFFKAIPPFQAAPSWRQMLEGVVTLMIGLAFFFITSTWPVTEKRLQKTLRWINWSGSVILGWSLIQEVVWDLYIHWPTWLRSIQKFFSSGTLFKDRVVGFTFEPSWLAHQLVILYLPLWLAATVLKHSEHGKKILGISLENLLLVGGIFMLYMSKSRLGLLAFLLCIACLLFEFSLKIAGWLQAKLKSKTAKRSVVISFYFGLILLAILLVLGSGFYLSKTDPRMQQLFDLQTLRNKPFLEYAEQLAFSARIVYWQAGWEIFGDHPFLGVGLGNAGFYFYDKLNPYAWELMEVRDYMFNFPSPPNIKSLWMRLLAETGVVGFAFWAVWLLLILFTGISLRKKNNIIARTLGLAGNLTLVALLIDGFSLDTFALPYYWVSFGLVVAAHQIQPTRSSPKEEMGEG